MRLYHLIRRRAADYDEYAGFVVMAPSRASALALVGDNLGHNPIVEFLGTASKRLGAEPRAIMEDFRAG